MHSQYDSLAQLNKLLMYTWFPTLLFLGTAFPAELLKDTLLRTFSVKLSCYMLF